MFASMSRPAGKRRRKCLGLCAVASWLLFASILSLYVLCKQKVFPINQPNSPSKGPIATKACFIFFAGQSANAALEASSFLRALLSERLVLN